MLILFVPIGGQSVVQPVRVRIAPPHDDALNRELTDVVTAELRKLGYVVLASKRPDYDVGFAIAPLSTCVGYAASMVIVDMDKPDERRISQYDGAGPQSIGRDLAAKLRKQFLSSPKRG